MTFAYYTSFDCGNCGETTVSNGLTVSTLEHNGHPVIPAGHAEQETVMCTHCTATIYTGELDLDIEGGRDPDDLDDDDSEQGDQ